MHVCCKRDKAMSSPKFHLKSNRIWLPSQVADGADADGDLGVPVEGLGLARVRRPDDHVVLPGLGVGGGGGRHEGDLAGHGVDAEDGPLRVDGVHRVEYPAAALRRAVRVGRLQGMKRVVVRLYITLDSVVLTLLP